METLNNPLLFIEDSLTKFKNEIFLFLNSKFPETIRLFRESKQNYNFSIEIQNGMVFFYILPESNENLFYFVFDNVNELFSFQHSNTAKDLEIHGIELDENLGFPYLDSLIYDSINPVLNAKKPRKNKFKNIDGI